MKQQIFVDASVLKDSACHRKLFFTIKDGYKLAGDSYRAEYKMGYGSAIHKFLEDYYKCLPAKPAIEKAVAYYEPYNAVVDMNAWEFRSSNNVIKTCKAYAERFPRIRIPGEERVELSPNDFHPIKDPTGVPCVEYKFAIPIWGNEKYDLILSGTIDLVCSYQDYPLVLVDHKTTSRKFEEAQYFFRDFDFNIQTQLYSKVWKEVHGLSEYPPVCINGIFCKKPTKKAEDIGIFDGVEFLRSPVIQYTEDKMEEFNEWLEKKLDMIISYLSNEDISPEYDMAVCHGGWKPCHMIAVCELPRIYQTGKLESAYVKQQYNPLAFRD